MSKLNNFNDFSLQGLKKITGGSFTESSSTGSVTAWEDGGRDFIPDALGEIQ